MDKTTEKRLAGVHDELAKRIRLLIADFASRGIEIRVVQGLRTAAEQTALYSQGRTKPGKRVTNAKAWQSNHNFGLAVDLCPFVKGLPQWNAPQKLWAEMGAAGEALGLEWGGRWQSFKDLPHLQLRGLSIATCQNLYKQGDLPAVWRQASALYHAAANAPAKTPTAPIHPNGGSADEKIAQNGKTSLSEVEAGAVSGVLSEVLDSTPALPLPQPVKTSQRAPNAQTQPPRPAVSTLNPAFPDDWVRKMPPNPLPPNPATVQAKATAGGIGILGTVAAFLYTAWDWVVQWPRPQIMVGVITSLLLIYLWCTRERRSA